MPAVDVRVSDHGRGEVVAGALLDGGPAIGLLQRRAQPVETEVGDVPADVVGDLVGHQGDVVTRGVHVARPAVLHVRPAGAQVDLPGGGHRHRLGQLAVGGGGQPIVPSAPAPPVGLVPADQDEKGRQADVQVGLGALEQLPGGPCDVGEGESPGRRLQGRMQRVAATPTRVAAQPARLGQQRIALDVHDGQPGHA